MSVCAAESLSLLSQEHLASFLSQCKECILVDVRPHAEFLQRHIRGAIHLHLNPMQLRRLGKGIGDLETAVTDQTCKDVLQKRFSDDAAMIVYDDSSSDVRVTPCIKEYFEILRRGIQGTLHVLNGGFQAFMKSYSHLCQAPVQLLRSASISKPPTLSLTGTPRSRCVYEETLLSSPRVPTCPPTEILPYLYIGTAKDSGNRELLKNLGITAVLNVSSTCPIHFEGSFQYKRIAVEDAYHTDLISEFKGAADFIDSQTRTGGKVLVHCFAGISRSATICISYLMLRNGWSMHQAFEYCRERRPCVSPNFNFMGQLLSYQTELSTCPIEAGSEGPDECPLDDDFLMEDNPSGPESLPPPTLSFPPPPRPTLSLPPPPPSTLSQKVFLLEGPCPKKRPISLSLKNSSSRSAGNSPCKRANGLLDGFAQSSSKLHSSATLSTSDSTLHCSQPLNLTNCTQTVTFRA